MRADGPDRVWHITGRVNWQVWHLESEWAYDVFTRALERAREQFAVNILSEVVMSNHYHFVAQSPPERLYRQLTSRRTPCGHNRPHARNHNKSTVIGQFMRTWKLAVARSVQKDRAATSRT